MAQSSQRRYYLLGWTGARGFVKVRTPCSLSLSLSLSLSPEDRYQRGGRQREEERKDLD